ncbi:MAG: YidC/Oxa1 family membrane protein insertase [Patescibacteria group bacterium]|jgi:YidC/Oxa1 family membrane protein insertase
MGNIFFALLYQPIYNALVFVYTLAPWGGLGLAIIVITVLVKTVVLPLTYKSMKAQKELQEIQPKIAEIKERFKDDKEGMAKELMGVYKVHNVNPFASCLPTIVQLVVFIALYQALAAGIHTVNGSILYTFVQNPGAMNPFFLGLDLSKISIPLGLLSGVLQYFQAKQMVTRRPPKTAQATTAALDEDMTATMNKMMLYALPITMIVLGTTTLLGGVTLYIVVSTAFTYGMYAFFLKPKA